jgi:endonuclease III
MCTSQATQERVKRIIGKLEKEHPDARLALDFHSPLELLVALILAAQCTDERVNEVTRSLFGHYRTARDYAAESQETLEAVIRSTGFYRQKARTIRECCRQIVECFAGEVPSEMGSLLTLPGVGRKTANILRGNAFGIAGIGVDTHVARLAQRLGLSGQKDPDKIEADLVPLVPLPRQVKFCHLLQYHGRRVCLARKPKCFNCAIAALCSYPDKTLPTTAKARPTRSRWMK